MKIILFPVLTFFFAIASPAATTKITYGAHEKVKLQPEGITYEAKMDTGAKTASLHVEEWTEFSKEGKTWIRFKVLKKRGSPPTTLTMERPLSRYVVIKPQPNLKAATRRPVVWLKLCLGKVTREVEVNLANRQHMDFPLLMGGQTIIAFKGVIDPNQGDLVPLACQ